MRYSKSMIEAVKQVGLYEALDYAIVDGDNKIIGLYKGNMAKKQAQLNMKGAERQVGIKKPLKIMPVSKKKKGDTVIGIGELTDKERGEIEEDVKNALAGFDNRIRDGGMDRKDFIKAKELYKRKDVKGLRKHIYSLDTSPLEVVMNLISIQDRPFFDKMYPNTRGGEFLARIAYQHRNLDENLDENKDDEKKRMKGAKLRLKMGDETIKEENIRVLVKDVKDRNFIKDLNNKAKQLKVDVSEKGGRYIFSGEKMKVNDVFNFAFDKSIKRGNYDPATMMHEEAELNEKKQAGYIAMYGDKKVEIPLNKAKDLYTAKQIAIKMMNVPKSKQGLLSINPAYEETIKEDGHTDVSSAVRQCKTILEDAMQIMGKLKSMSGEDSLPTWWTNKLAVASNSMNKMRDYILVPSDGMQEKLDKEETIKSKDLLDNKFKEEKNGAQHFSKIEEDNYVWNFVYDDFGRTKLTTEPDKATHLVYTMEGKDNPQLLKLSEKEILDYKKGENNELSKKKEK